MEKNNSVKVKRVGGYLHKVTPVFDESGKILAHVITPLMVELKPRDIAQIVIGSCLLSIPVAMTEEVWTLSHKLPAINLVGLATLSLVIISTYVYFNFYRHNLQGNLLRLVTRIIAVYLISMISVALILTLIDQCPWQTNLELAIRRIILVSLPASFSATIADSLK